MGAFLAIINKIMVFIKNHKQLSLSVAVVTLFVLFLMQCQQTRKAEERSAQNLIVAKQNIQALTDKSYQLQMTKDQLKKTDAELYNITIQLEKQLKAKGKIKEVTKTKIVYKDTTIISGNVVEQKANSDTVKISFTSKDLVRSFDVDNYVLLVRDTTGNYKILADHSEVKNFKLNFDIVFAEYKDSKGFDRVKAFAVNSETNKEIPEEILQLNWRNVQILNKPFEQNKPKSKFWANGIGISINPIGMFPTYNNGQMKMVYMPNISIGYYFGINLNK